MRFEEAYAGWNQGRLTQEEALTREGCWGCDRSFRRYLERFEADGLEGLADRRLSQVSQRRAPVDEVMKLGGLYQRGYAGWNVKAQPQNRTVLLSAEQAGIARGIAHAFENEAGKSQVVACELGCDMSNVPSPLARSVSTPQNNEVVFSTAIWRRLRPSRNANPVALF